MFFKSNSSTIVIDVDNTEQKLLLQYFQEKISLDQLRSKLFSILSNEEILRDIICNTAFELLQQLKKTLNDTKEEKISVIVSKHKLFCTRA